MCKWDVSPKRNQWARDRLGKLFKHLDNLCQAGRAKKPLQLQSSEYKTAGSSSPRHSGIQIDGEGANVVEIKSFSPVALFGLEQCNTTGRFIPGR